MDQKLLDIEGIVSGSSSINQESSNLTEVCASLYSLVTSLRENEDFKTMVASSEYFGSIDILNQQVPRYAEALLQFSKFLSNYVLENYSDTDAEMKAKVEANLAEAIAKLGETDETVGTGVDYSKISTTAAGALSGDFIDSSKIQKSTFEDGELEFITRPDGSVQIVKNGSVLGYTTQDGIGNAQTATSATTGAETEELHTSLSSGEIAGTVASMATLGTGAVAGSTTTGDATASADMIASADATIPTDTTAIDPGFSGTTAMTAQNPAPGTRLMDVPDVNSEFKAYMDYRTITSKDSKQYAMQHSENCFTDESGFRKIRDENGEEYYMGALGSYYTEGEVGKKYQITLDTGETFKFVAGDQKADIHTNSTNQYRDTGTTTNVVEFIVDDNQIPSDCKRAGSMSGAYGGQFGGNVVKIEMLDDGKPIM